MEQKRSFWDGVRNYQARNFIKKMSKGDLAYLYHSSCAEIGIAGVMEIDSIPMADPTQFDKKSKYFDPKSTLDNPRWWGVSVKPQKAFSRIVSLEQLKKLPELREHPLVQRGNRLSILPVEENAFAAIAQILKRM